MPRRATKDADLTPFGRWLRKQYTGLHYNKTGFAKLIGVAHGTVGEWETGKTKPRDANVRKIAGALGVPESEVHRALGRTGPTENELPEDVRRIRDVLLLLPPEGREVVENTARSVAALLQEEQEPASDEGRGGGGHTTRQRRVPS